MILSLAALTTFMFFPDSDDWITATPTADYVYVCGAHTAGYLHANLTVHSNMVIDFDCPNNPGTIDAKGYDSGLVLRRVHDVTIRNPRISNAGRGLLLANVDRVTVTGGEIHHTLSVAGIELRKASRDVTIEGVTIHDNRNGIWVGARPTEVAGHQRLRIVSNLIRDSYGDPDSHGIALQTASYSYIANNIVMRTDGPAIAMYWWNGASKMIGNVFEGNTIHAIRASGRSPYVTTPRGFDFGGSNGTGTGRYNNIVRYNVVFDIEGDAMYLKGSLTPANQYSLEVTDNYVLGRVSFGSTTPGAIAPLYLRNPT